MSVFGQRMQLVSPLFEQEWADIYHYTPMHDVINGDPEPDPTRAEADVFVIVLQPGQQLGMGWGLNPMHSRASSTPTLYYRLKTGLMNVQKKDRLQTASTSAFAESPRRYELMDGPEPIGFGWFKAGLVELTLFDET